MTNNNVKELIFRSKKLDYQNMLQLFVSYLNFILKSRESYEIYNNYILHQNKIFVSRLIAYIILIAIEDSETFRRIFFPLKNILMKNKCAYEKAFRK